jgi:hypothetical protein
MKVAVCYSGFLRNIEKTFPNILDKMLSSHSVDFFIHTWDVEEYEDEIEYSKKNINPKLILVEKQKHFERNPFSFINCDLTEEEYKIQLQNSGEHHKFVPIPCEQNNFKFDKELEVVKFGYYSSFPYNFLSQFYSLYKAIELKKIYEQQNEFEYDCVIRIRPDVFLYDTIDLNLFDLKTINLFTAPLHKGTNLTINDHFACSLSNLIDVYSECFLFLSTYYFVYKIDFIQEIILGKHLEINNINTTKYPIKYLITRDSIHKEKYPKFIR